MDIKVTLQDAKDWRDSEEQYLFCDDFLSRAGISGSLTENPPYWDSQIDALERKFEEVLRYDEDSNDYKENKND